MRHKVTDHSFVGFKKKRSQKIFDKFIDHTARTSGFFDTSTGYGLTSVKTNRRTLIVSIATSEIYPSVVGHDE